MGGISETQAAVDDGTAKTALFKEESIKESAQRKTLYSKTSTIKVKKAQITILLSLLCAAMIFSLCLFHQSLPLKSVKYGECTVLLSITPTRVLQGSGNKQIDSHTAWPADRGSFINTTTLTANPGKDAAILPPPKPPTGPI